MNRKKITRNHFLLSRGLSRITAAFILAIIYMCGTILGASTAYASGVPGGNITDPVVQGVDIAEPAVVRIIAKATGRLTVQIPTPTGGRTRVTFPQNGTSYPLEYFGSGAFISAHGDILTANHLVQPDQALYEAAAQDIADYINKQFGQVVTANDVLALLIAGALPSQAQYDSTPTMRVYFNTDFTGPMNNATTLNAMPSGSYADVDKIEKTVDFNHGDIAILHVNMDDTPSIKLGDSTSVQPQDQLTIIGFPGDADLLTASAQTAANAINPSTGFFTASLNKVFVSALKQSPVGAPLIQVGGNVAAGDSGGPALDSNGNIVGIVSFGTSQGGSTSFLQASQSAQQLINDLQLNTLPGTFQSAWSQAFAQYSSPSAGHWHTAQQDLQQLANNYPNFHGVQPFLDYATTQASKETTSPLSPGNLPLVIGIAALILIVVVALLVFFSRAQRKRRLQGTLATQTAASQPAYAGTQLPAESERFFPSGNMTPVDAKDGMDLDSNRVPNIQLEQSRSMQATPQVPQTPIPVPQPAQAAPMGSYYAGQSGQSPVVPNQQPMNPWPQPAGYEAASPYGQPYSYGQQPFNAAQQPRPAQNMSNPPYPVQQQQYGPYSQPPAGTPYAAQNPAQQDATIRRAQQPPAYGTPYGQPPAYGTPYGQSPQAYGGVPAQPGPQSRPSSPSIPAQRWQPPEEPTVRSSQQGPSASEEIIKTGEE